MKLAKEEIGLCSEAGVRPRNEDCAEFHLAKDGSAALLVLADGMGGEACGEVASDIAVQTLVSAFRKYGFSEAEALLAEAITTAHERIRQAAARDAGKEGMGTTLVAAVLGPEEVLVGHVGDSRAFQFRPPYVRRLTQDHLYIIEALGLEEKHAREHPKGHILAQALGIPGEVRPALNRFTVDPGDCVVLCTDGVHGVLPEPEMSRILASGPLQQATARMVSQALENGSRDNCTALAARVGS